jgi:hypothetical protein
VLRGAILAVMEASYRIFSQADGTFAVERTDPGTEPVVSGHFKTEAEARRLKFLERLSRRLRTYGEVNYRRLASPCRACSFRKLVRAGHQPTCGPPLLRGKLLAGDDGDIAIKDRLGDVE